MRAVDSTLLVLTVLAVYTTILRRRPSLLTVGCIITTLSITHIIGNRTSVYRSSTSIGSTMDSSTVAVYSPPPLPVLRLPLLQQRLRQLLQPLPAIAQRTYPALLRQPATELSLATRWRPRRQWLLPPQPQLPAFLPLLASAKTDLSCLPPNVPLCCTMRLCVAMQHSFILWDSFPACQTVQSAPLLPFRQPRAHLQSVQFTYILDPSLSEASSCTPYFLFTFLNTRLVLPAADDSAASTGRRVGRPRASPFYAGRLLPPP